VRVPIATPLWIRGHNVSNHFVAAGTQGLQTLRIQAVFDQHKAVSVEERRCSLSEVLGLWIDRIQQVAPAQARLRLQCGTQPND